MAFSVKKPRRNMSITSSEFEWMHQSSGSCEGGEGGGVGREDSVGVDDGGSGEFEVLREGYLNMSVRVEEGDDRSGTMARTLKTLRSNGSFSRSWKKRWCVLCRTADGVSIFYYNKQSSYANLDVPVGIFFLEESRKIFTIPGHPKSRSVFAIDFPYRTVHLYPEKEHQLADWLDILKTSLRLTKHSASPPPSLSPPSPSSSCSSSSTSSFSSKSLVRGTSKRRSRKRGYFSCGNDCIEEEEGVVLARAIITATDCTEPANGVAPDNYMTCRTVTS